MQKKTNGIVLNDFHVGIGIQTNDSSKVKSSSDLPAIQLQNMPVQRLTRDLFIKEKGYTLTLQEMKAKLLFIFRKS
jgi:hypothetical protein